MRWSAIYARVILDIAPSAEEVKQKIRGVGEGRKWGPIMVMDGAHVPTRPEEAKGKRSGRKKVRAKLTGRVEGSRIQVLSLGWREDRAYSELASGSEQ